MIDVTSNEVKQQIRAKFFSNTLVTSGVVQVVDEPLQNAVNHVRYQSWRQSNLSELSGAIDDRIGDYVSRHLGQSILSTLGGVTATKPLPEAKEDQDAYRVSLRDLFRPTMESGTDHTIALVPSFVYSYFNKLSLPTYHLCPFTQKRIPSYQGNNLCGMICVLV